MNAINAPAFFFNIFSRNKMSYDYNIFAFYNENASYDTIIKTMKMFCMVSSDQSIFLSTESKHNSYEIWVKFLKDTEASNNPVAIILCLHGSIEDGDLKFDNQSLASWLDYQLIGKKSILILPIVCFNTNADVKPLAKYLENIRGYKTNNSLPAEERLIFRQIGKKMIYHLELLIQFLNVMKSVENLRLRYS